MVTSRPQTSLATLAALLLSLLLSSALVAGCSDDSGTSSSSSSSESSSSPSATSDTCAAIDRFRTDVTAMAESASVQEFHGHYDAARADFAELRSSASADLGPEVDKVDKALQQFGDALAKLGDNGGNQQQVQQLGVAAQQLVTAVQGLAAQASC